MTIFNKIANILSELSNQEVICLEHDLQKDLALDSLQMVTLLIKLEESFQITLDESDMNPFDLITVSHVVNLVEKYVGDTSNESSKTKN